MIVDCHTHIWDQIGQLGAGAEAHLRRQGLRQGVSAAPADHNLAQRCVDASLVFAFRCAANEACVPNEFVARYVSGSGGRVLGVAAVDPTEDDAASQAAEWLDRREFCGLTVSPAVAGFHPADSRAMRVYQVAAERGKPVFFCQGGPWPIGGRLEYARPSLLDEVALEFPDLRVVISSLGYPWVEECLMLLANRPNVWADLAGLLRRPWQAYNALVPAHQFGVTDKLLFASDFPFSTPAEAIEGIYRLAEVTQGTNLPTVPREALRSIVERDAVAALGLAGSNRTAESGGKEKEEDSGL
jgi:hypothetical protein